VPLNNNNPNDWTQVLTVIWVIMLSIWGGTVHTIKKVRDGIIERFTFKEWVYDVITSAFIGVITYALCKYAGFGEWLSAAMIGMASHQGTRALLIIEQAITKRLGVK
jgi:hypothetical protein